MGYAHKGIVAGAVIAAAAGTVMAGPDWVETGDAGGDVITAQVPTGTSGNLNTISGTLTGTGFLADFEDCYIIRINDPAAFSMTITSANFNTQIYMFNISLPGGAFGLLANDDISAGNQLSRFTNVSTDGTNVIVSLPGDYMIGVTGFNRDPVSQTGAIFNNAASLTEVSGPDGPGGFNNLTGWNGTGQTGNYIITLTGAGFPAFPAPGAGALLAMAGMVGLRRRR